jgi:hypothetical protein
MLRQPHAAAARLATDRASMMPSSRPLVTCPTYLPRLCSGARWAASGMSTWATTEVTPTSARAIRNTPKPGAAAATASATAVTSSVREESLRFSSRSPSGSSSASPSA